MKRKRNISKNKVHQLRMGVVRENKKSQGFFDGRFVSRVQDSKKKYNRKRKHKNKQYTGSCLN